MAVNGAKKAAPALDFNEGFVQIINGKSAPTGSTRHGINPANLKPKAEVPVATQESLDAAVEAAKKAFKTWSKVPYEERRKAVLAYADAVEAYKTEFRDLLISEQGKPVRPRRSPLARAHANLMLPDPSSRWRDGSCYWVDPRDGQH